MRKPPSGLLVSSIMTVVSPVFCLVSVVFVGLWSFSFVAWLVTTLAWWILFLLLVLDDMRSKRQGVKNDA